MFSSCVVAAQRFETLGSYYKNICAYNYILSSHLSVDQYLCTVSIPYFQCVYTVVDTTKFPFPILWTELQDCAYLFISSQSSSTQLFVHKYTIYSIPKYVYTVVDTTKFPFPILWTELRVYVYMYLFISSQSSSTQLFVMPPLSHIGVYGSDYTVTIPMVLLSLPPVPRLALLVLKWSDSFQSHGFYSSSKFGGGGGRGRGVYLI